LVTTISVPDIYQTVFNSKKSLASDLQNPISAVMQQASELQPRKLKVDTF
jgi:hypothetical protein